MNTARVDPWWIEARLPHGVSPWRESNRAVTPLRDANLPMPAEAIVRFEQRNGEYAAVYQSTQYDQPGEIPSYGLWFARTIGHQWQRPVYLGLQSHFPYVPTAGSAVPLLEGDRLRIEVQVREIDRESITFPPVGLTVGRSEDGVLLEFSLERLGRDSDGDDFPDIEERRLGLSADNPDSDGDGLNDSADPLPLTRYDPNTLPERRMLAEAILNQILGHDGGAIVIAPVSRGAQLSLEDELLRAMGSGQIRPPTQTPTIFLGADPSLFAGLQSRVRLIVYSKDDLAALSNGAAPFYPPRISNIFSSPDGRTHFVIWTADWVGGTFIVRCSEGAAACETETVISWIT